MGAGGGGDFGGVGDFGGEACVVASLTRDDVSMGFGLRPLF